MRGIERAHTPGRRNQHRSREELQRVFALVRDGAALGCVGKGVHGLALVRPRSVLEVLHGIANSFCRVRLVLVGHRAAKGHNISHYSDRHSDDSGCCLGQGLDKSKHLYPFNATNNRGWLSRGGSIGKALAGVPVMPHACDEWPVVLEKAKQEIAQRKQRDVLGVGPDGEHEVHEEQKRAGGDDGQPPQPCALNAIKAADSKRLNLDSHLSPRLLLCGGLEALDVAVEGLGHLQGAAGALKPDFGFLEQESTGHIPTVVVTAVIRDARPTPLLAALLIFDEHARLGGALNFNRFDLCAKPGRIHRDSHLSSPLLALGGGEWCSGAHAPHCRNDTILNAAREDIRPLVHRLVCDADCLSGGGDGPAEQFNGLCFKHGQLNHSSEHRSTEVQPPRFARGMIAHMKHLKDRLKWAMEQKGMSIPDLLRASEADITYQGVKKMLDKIPADGKAEKMDAHNCIHLATALDVAPVWLLTGKGAIRQGGEHSEMPGSITIYDALRHLSEALMRVDSLDRGMASHLLSELAMNPGGVGTVAVKLARLLGDKATPPASSTRVDSWVETATNLEEARPMGSTFSNFTAAKDTRPRQGRTESGDEK